MRVEPSITKSDHERDSKQPEDNPARVDAAAGIQAALSEAMTAVNVGASFDLDCAARPCLAVFADQIPSEEERAAVVQRLVDSQPGLELTSATIVAEDGRVSWVLELANESLTREEKALVDARVEDLLP